MTKNRMEDRPVAAQREADIPAAMMELENAGGKINEALGMLQSRLEPVLRCDPREDSISKPTDGGCVLSRAIRQQAERLSYFGDQLFAILNDLDLP